MKLQLCLALRVLAAIQKSHEQVAALAPLGSCPSNRQPLAAGCVATLVHSCWRLASPCTHLEPDCLWVSCNTWRKTPAENPNSPDDGHQVAHVVLAAEDLRSGMFSHWSQHTIPSPALELLPECHHESAATTINCRAGSSAWHYTCTQRTLQGLTAAVS